MNVDAVEEDDGWLANCRLHVFGHIHEARGAEIVVRRRRRSLSKSTGGAEAERPEHISGRPNRIYGGVPEPGSGPEEAHAGSSALPALSDREARKATVNGEDTLNIDDGNEDNNGQGSQQIVETVFVNAAGKRTLPIIVDLRNHPI